jgi:hypothetical protein
VTKPAGNAPQEERSQAEEKGDQKLASGQAAKASSTEKSEANREFRSVPGVSVLASTTDSVSHANPTPRTSPNLQDRPQSAVGVKEVETNTTIRPQPIREISLRLTDKASNPVDIQVAQRAGHVQVAVRTPDQELSSSLQTHLGDLVGRLEAKGYKTESWIPSATAHTAAAASESAQNSNPQNSNPGHDQPGNSGSWGGEKQQGQDPSDSGRRQHARWMNEVEQSIQGEETGMDSLRLEER